MEPENNQAPFDPKALAEQVSKVAVEAATKIAEDRAAAVAKDSADKLAKAAAILTGTPEVDKNEQILQGFIKDPVKFAKTIHESAVNTVMSTMAKNKATEQQQMDAIGPFIREYPELRGNKLKLVEKLAEEKEKGGMAYGDALKEAAAETVKEFKMEKVSEAQRNSAAFYAGLPGGGGMGSGVPVRDEGKAQTDFISGMKARLSSFRVRK